MIQGQVTVFYLVYLFWFQEFVRTIINSLYLQRTLRERSNEVATENSSGSFLLLFIYLIFIIVFFGFILNWGNLSLMTINMRTLFFHNAYFNINMLIFAVQYYLYRKQAGMHGLEAKAFNSNHIVLHVSIVMGGLIQMFLVKKYPQYFSANELWGSTLVVLPFLLMKVLLSNNNPFRWLRRSGR